MRIYQREKPQKRPHSHISMPLPGDPGASLSVRLPMRPEDFDRLKEYLDFYREAFTTPIDDNPQTWYDAHED